MLLARTGILPGSGTRSVRIGAWVVAGILGLSVLANAISRSASERVVMTLIALTLAASAVVIALGNPQGG